MSRERVAAAAAAGAVDLTEHAEVMIDDPAAEELRGLLVPTRRQWARVVGRVAPHSRRCLGRRAIVSGGRP